MGSEGWRVRVPIRSHRRLSVDLVANAGNEHQGKQHHPRYQKPGRRADPQGERQAGRDDRGKYAGAHICAVTDEVVEGRPLFSSCGGERSRGDHHHPQAEQGQGRDEEGKIEDRVRRSSLPGSARHAKLRLGSHRHDCLPTSRANASPRAR